jgi:hypothetical protein
MNPTQEQIREMYEWYQARLLQQIATPLDDASKHGSGLAFGEGDGTTGLTDTITIGSGGGTANVPKAYRGTKLINIDGAVYEFGFIRRL